MSPCPSELQGFTSSSPRSPSWPSACLLLCRLKGLTSRIVIVAYSMPVWASLMAWMVLGERLNARTTIGLFLAIVGLTVLTWPLAAEGFPLDLVLALGSELGGRHRLRPLGAAQRRRRRRRRGSSSCASSSRRRPLRSSKVIRTSGRSACRRSCPWRFMGWSEPRRPTFVVRHRQSVARRDRLARRSVPCRRYRLSSSVLLLGAGRRRRTPSASR